jgi:hypothetical protein
MRDKKQSGNRCAVDQYGVTHSKGGRRWKANLNILSITTMRGLGKED